MRRPLNRAFLSLALLAACAASAQAAAVSIQADLSNLTLTATDLNLSDGQAASFAWASQPKNFVGTDVVILQNGWENIKNNNRDLRNTLPILSSQVALGNTGAASSLDLHGAHLTAHANDGLGAYANGWAREIDQQPSILLVSPFTRVTLNAQASVAFLSDPSCKTVVVGGFERSCSDGHATLSVDLFKGAPQPGGSNSFQLSLDFDSRTGSDQLGTPILLTIENNSAEATYFGLAFGGAVWVHDNTPAGSVVPEPGELGMLLAGLGTLLLVRRRKSALLKKGWAVAAVATLSAPAWSAMTLDTQIAQLQFTVTDLTPADAQAASFEWLSPSAGNVNAVDALISSNNIWPPLARDTHQGGSLLAPVSAAVQVGDVKATASITADGLHLRSESNGVASTNTNANLGPTSGYANNLWVAPHTRVTVTGQATFQFTNNYLCPAANPDLLTCGYAFSDYHLGFRKSNGLDLATSYRFSAGAYKVGPLEVTVPIVLSFENNRSEGALLQFYGYTRNGIMVPEPDALALMFAGVLVSCIARRATKRR